MALRARMPLPSVPLVDLKTGLMTFDWYDYFASQLQQSVPLGDFANDAAAAAGGVPLFALYRTGSAVKQRVT